MGAKTHQELRSLVCLVCGLKGSSPRKLTGEILKKVQKHFFSNYDPSMVDIEKFPSSCCSKCYNDLVAVENGKKTSDDLPDIIDFPQLNFPKITRYLTCIRLM